MRTHLVALLVVVLLIVGLVPASAQLGIVGGSSAMSFTASIFLDTDTKSPVGQMHVSFTDHTSQGPVYYYRGTSRELLVGDDDPAYRFCVVEIDLSGPLADQIVKSSWRNHGPRTENTFVCAIGPGMQEFTCSIQGKKTRTLRFLFIPIPVGSSSFATEQSFRVLSQSGDGLSDYKCQFDLAKQAWPSAGEEMWTLWARLFVYESWYKAQGMVLAGTEKYPRNTTATLRDWLTMKQAEADAADARKRAEAADAQRRAAAPPPANLVEVNSDPPVATATVSASATAAPVQVTAKAETKPVPAPEVKPEIAPANASWLLILPPGRKYGRIITSNAAGNESVYNGSWSGALRFTKATPGVIYIQLTGIAGPEPWRVAEIVDGCTVNYSALKEAK